MKKIIFTAILFFSLAASALAVDILPEFVIPAAPITYGVYQVGHGIALYSEPNDKAPVVKKITWNTEGIIPNDLTFADLFAVYIGKNDLALMSVTDETDDWVEVIYDNRKGLKGWIKKDDPFKFNTWMNFYNMYGRKYGLVILKGAPEFVYSLFGTPEDNEKAISTINQPKLINLNLIRGNWMLVTVVDADGTPKTGYIRWRSDDGVKYLFPDIK